MQKNNLIKEDLIKKLNLQTGYSINFSKKIINDLIEIIISNIKSGSLNIKNLELFKLIYKKKRLGRNPKTMEPFTIKSRKSVSFIPSKKILQKLDDLYE